MGLSASKKVEKYLQSSTEFSSATAATYGYCVSLSQHAFAGVKPYQLFSATEHLHRLLYPTFPLVSKWVHRSPDRAQVDRALKTVLSRRSPRDAETTLDEEEFKEFATELFADAVVLGARREVLKMMPLGVAGIAGVGAVVRPGKNVVAAAIGAYALGVVTSVYLGLNG